jgi:ricin-type beta-trefoil lectin protein
MRKRQQQPHFEHHRREAALTRSQFRLALLVLFVGLSVVVGSQSRGIHADTVTTPQFASAMSGQCLDDYHDSSTNDNPVVMWPCDGSPGEHWTVNGQYIQINGLCLDVKQGGTANGSLVEIYTCHNGTNQQWNRGPAKSINSQTYYDYVNANSGTCLDGLAPGTANGTQIQIWKCNGDTQQYWVPGSKTVVTTPVPTPTPTSGGGGGGGTKPTPTPGGGGSGGGGGGSGGGSGSGSGSGGGSTSGGGGGGGGIVSSGGITSTAAAPTTPGNFTAVADNTNAVISLSWTASSDVAGIQSYQLERSIDNATWQILSTNITDVTYDDTTVDFGVHYYYRIKAIDYNGNESGYATADATTAAFVGTATSGGGSTSYTSDDGLATVTLPDGAVAGSVDCSVTVDTTTNFTTKQRKVVAGPYQLLCKDANANTVTSFSQPLAWSVKLKNKLKGVTKPTAYTADANANLNAISNAKFSNSSKVMTFTTTTANDVLVLGTITHGISWDLVVIILVILGVMGGVAVLILRRQQKSNYDDYLRTKYYNL